MKDFSFSVSLIRAWLRGRVAVDDSLVHVTLPYTIFWIISLGSHRESIPAKNISSVKEIFHISVPQIIVGIVMVYFTMFDITHGHKPLAIFLLFFLGVILILDAIRVIITIEKSGQSLAIRLPFYERAKARQITSALRQLIQRQ